MQIRTFSLNLGTSNKNLETTKFSVERTSKRIRISKKFWNFSKKHFTNFFIMKMLHNQNLQKITFNHRLDIDCKDFAKIYQKMYCKIIFFFSIQGSHTQNNWVAPRLTQPVILPRSIKWVPGISENSVVESKLPPHSSSAALRWLNFILKNET